MGELGFTVAPKLTVESILRCSPLYAKSPTFTCLHSVQARTERFRLEGVMLSLGDEVFASGPVAEFLKMMLQDGI